MYAFNFSGPYITGRLKLKRTLKMIKMILMMCFITFGEILCNNQTANVSDSNKDMYVIHAMVYQVGIITNRTDDKAANMTMGNQEALTFYRTNGSKVDLSSIPAPLMTNVTAQSMVQVAPKTPGAEQKPQISWSALKDIASLPQSPAADKSENGGLKIVRRSNFDNDLPQEFDDMEYYDVTPQEAYTRSVRDLREDFKRAVSDEKPNVKVVKGSALIPQGAGVQSIAIPPLLALNNNLSNIPVPIPNTSVVHYAKINTLVRKP